MPVVPVSSTLNANSVGILNAIRNEASADYYNAVPAVTDTTESIRAAGQAIMAYQPRMNEFINSLVNRIALVVVTSKRYSNPLSFCKKGVVEFGETIEEIFVNIAKVRPFKTGLNGANLFKKTTPDIRSAFHAMNVRSQYYTTVSVEQLRQAFLSMDGVTNLIARIVDQLYSALNYDEFILTKYLIAVLALDGSLPIVTIPEVTDESTGKQLVESIRELVELMKFKSANYNIAGVLTETTPDRLYTFNTAKITAKIDVQVLASAFNMDKTDFIGQRVSLDSFGFNKDELLRLAMLLWDDATLSSEHDTLPVGVDPTAEQLYDFASKIISDEDNTLLKSVQTLVCDRDFFQIYDNLADFFTEQWDATELQWNEFLNAWRTFSASPFANVVMYTSETPEVTNVEVVGPTNVKVGSTVVYTANVTASNFANKGVIWSSDKGSIDQNGRINFSANEVGTVKITATSAFDDSQTNTLSVTVTQ